ncbi:hypothetical protein KC887_04380 [Candidatus Kaiserbacteria bacterium]|nr:hypothetical protein [Candidatus Kaiserbacteria bacterium]
MDYEAIHAYIEGNRGVRGIDMAFGRLLVEQAGVADNPKASQLFKLAWNYGHSEGHWEVLEYFEQMLPLIQ